MKHLLLLASSLLWLSCSKKELPVYHTSKMSISNIIMPTAMKLGDTARINVLIQTPTTSTGFNRFDISPTDEYNLNIKAITFKTADPKQIIQPITSKTLASFEFAPLKPGMHFLYFINEDGTVITKPILVK